ncbi:MAG: carbon-nitrogen hydrolase family protein [Gammaproteobacteria bacterium]|nr:carbon-nitrogen hydrolase family protein [Gammaproteobacteria bacterium]MCG3143339.1 Deaminated glutathione amidase [Gammaproteobacteria bacterium]
MAETFKVACIQNCAENDLERNLEETTKLTRAAENAGAQLVCLPEYFAFMAPSDQELLRVAPTEDAHPALAVFKDLARELHVWLLLGSLAIRVPSGRVNNRSYLIDSDGQVAASYNKVHLFDVTLKGGESYSESSAVEAGAQAVVAQTPWGKLGMSICYDIRFAYLYRLLAQSGASYLTVPAAFTRTTGQAHWHVLIRARAIETGCFVFAPGQCGRRSWGRATFGHSLIVDPWGTVLAEGTDAPGFIVADIDPSRVEDARQMIPALNHDRPLRSPD